MHVLDPDLLLPFASVPTDRIDEHGAGPRELIGGVQLVVPDFRGLLWADRAAVAFHAGIMRCQ
jgi:hypothetical protein